jgi:hypothetical protein
MVRDAIKYPLPKEAPKPGKFREPAAETPAALKSEAKADAKTEAAAEESK